MMLFVALYIDGTEGTHRAEVLAGSTTDTTVFIYNRYPRRLLVIRMHRHHGNGANRAVTSTIATRSSIDSRQTVLLDPHSMTYLLR